MIKEGYVEEWLAGENDQGSNGSDETQNKTQNFHNTAEILNIFANSN